MTFSFTDIHVDTSCRRSSVAALSASASRSVCRSDAVLGRGVPSTQPLVPGPAARLSQRLRGELAPMSIPAGPIDAGTHTFRMTLAGSDDPILLTVTVPASWSSTRWLGPHDRRRDRPAGRRRDSILGRAGLHVQRCLPLVHDPVRGRAIGRLHGRGSCGAGPSECLDPSRVHAGRGSSGGDSAVGAKRHRPLAMRQVQGKWLLPELALRNRRGRRGTTRARASRTSFGWWTSMVGSSSSTPRPGLSFPMTRASR